MERLATRKTPAHTWLFFLLVGALLTLSTNAHADDAAQAAELAREAEALMSKKAYAKACSKLSKSLLLDARSATALELGRCRVKEGKPGSAYRAYGEAMELAEVEERSDRMAQAKAQRNKLVFKISRVTVNVSKDAFVAGLTISIDGEPVPEDKWGKSYESDPGTRVFAAEAPGRKRWEKKVTLRPGKNAPVSVPKMAVDKGWKPKPPPKEDDEPSDDDDDDDDKKDDDDDDDEEEEEEEDDDEPLELGHEANRLVVEVGVFGGLLYSDIAKGSLSELFGATYTFSTVSQGELIASCGDTTTIPGGGECEALFDPIAGGLVGGQLFLGWAVHEDVHLGLRGYGAARFPDGFFIAGGPAISFRPVGPLWLGAAFLLGTEQHRGTLAEARGSVPEDQRPANGGNDQVGIPLETLAFSEGDVAAGFMFGGALEISVALFGPSPNAVAPTALPVEFFRGALMVSIWPGFMKAPDGFDIIVPGGFSYRFH